MKFFNLFILLCSLAAADSFSKNKEEGKDHHDKKRI